MSKGTKLEQSLYNQLQDEIRARSKAQEEARQCKAALSQFVQAFHDVAFAPQSEMASVAVEWLKRIENVEKTLCIATDAEIEQVKPVSAKRAKSTSAQRASATCSL